MSYIKTLKDARVIKTKGETIYEFDIGDFPHGIAIADIKESRLHHHLKTHEWYWLAEGSGEIVLDGKTRKIRKHDFIYIKPGTKHKVKSTDGILLIVISYPKWRAEDHIIDE